MVEIVFAAVKGVIHNAVLSGEGAGRQRVPADAGIGRKGLNESILSAHAHFHQVQEQEGRKPCRAYDSIRSGRIPSATKNNTLPLAEDLSRPRTIPRSRRAETHPCPNSSTTTQTSKKAIFIAPPVYLASFPPCTSAPTEWIMIQS